MNKKRLVSVLLLLAMLLTSVGALAADPTSGKVKAGYNASVFSVAAEDFTKILAAIGEGTSVNILRSEGNFYAISYGGGEGYVLKSNIDPDSDIIPTDQSQNNTNNIPNEPTVQYKIRIVAPAGSNTVTMYADQGITFKKNLTNNQIIEYISTSGNYSYVKDGADYGYVLFSQTSTDLNPPAADNSVKKQIRIVPKAGTSTVVMYSDKFGTFKQNLNANQQVGWIRDEDNWSYINASNVLGYVEKQYTSTDLNPTPPANVQYDVYIVPPTGSTSVAMYKDMNNSFLQNLNAGLKVGFISSTGNWSYIKVGDSTLGYVETRYTSRTQPSTTYVRVVAGINMTAVPMYREASSANFIKNIPDGTVVVLMNRGTYWSQVDYSGTVGYVETKYISDNTQNPYYMYVKMPNNTQTLGLFPQTGGVGTPLGRYYSGTKVQVLSYGTTWSRVRVDNKEGYMETRYLSTDDGGGNTGNYVWATVNNPNPLDKLILRAQPSMNSDALGRYSNGTTVKVYERGAEWCRVEVGSLSGYMMTRYLYFDNVNPNPPNPGNYVLATVNNPNPKDRLNLRAQPSKNSTNLGRYYNGTSVKVYERGPIWCRVEVSGIQGYMMTEFLYFGGGSNPNPGNPGTVIGYATVNNPNPRERLNLRASPTINSTSLGQYYNGTVVKIFQNLGTWSHVEVNGKVGYMMNSYLSFSGSGGSSGGGTGYRQAVVNNANPRERLNLRASASINSTSLGQYYNGTVVRVLEYGATWCRVEVNGIYGYMMTSYLRML